MNTCDLWIKGRLHRDCTGATATVYFVGLICVAKQEVYRNIQRYKIQVYTVCTDVTTVCVASCVLCVEVVIQMYISTMYYRSLSGAFSALQL
jgi:hypothetical protein